MGVHPQRRQAFNKKILDKDILAQLVTVKTWNVLLLEMLQKIYASV